MLFVEVFSPVLDGDAANDTVEKVWSREVAYGFALAESRFGQRVRNSKFSR